MLRIKSVHRRKIEKVGKACVKDTQYQDIDQRPFRYDKIRKMACCRHIEGQYDQ